MMQYLPDSARFERMTADEVRTHFLVSGLFKQGQVSLRFTDLDRVVLGGIVPVEKPLSLGAPEALRAEYFTERREIGLLNIGGAGGATVDGRTFPMQRLDGLYVGQGSREVTLASEDPTRPARYYLVSYPAYTSHPTTHLRRADADLTELGSGEKSNRRNLYKYIHGDGIRSDQLVMGVTELLEGSVWNTLPPHTHARRTEVYLYFDMMAEDVVFHLMGTPGATRSIVVRDAEAVLSPGWSIHAGAGTSRYMFCWAMGGENQDFADMQFVNMRELK